MFGGFLLTQEQSEAEGARDFGLTSRSASHRQMFYPHWSTQIKQVYLHIRRFPSRLQTDIKLYIL